MHQAKMTFKRFLKQAAFLAGIQSSTTTHARGQNLQREGTRRDPWGSLQTLYTLADYIS